MTPKPASKPTIAVDIDDVLSLTAKGFISYSNNKWGTHLTLDDWSEHWAEMWKVDDEEAHKRADDFFNSGLVKTYSRNKDAEKVLKQLSTKYKLVVVSSRSKVLYPDSREWINLHFNGIFEEIHFAGIYDNHKLHVNEKLKMTKSEVLADIGADYLIDDQPKHCVAAAEAGIMALLFGDYKWNHDVNPLKNMVKVRDWQAVKDFFNAESR